MFNDAERDIGSVVLPRWGRVAAAVGLVPWLVADPGGVRVEPIRRYLADFVAGDNRAGSVRGYAYGLLRWWRWLLAVGVEWDRAAPAEARDLVLWLKQAAKLRVAARAVSAATAGTVDPVTRKRNLGDRYAVARVRHSNAVIRAFYEFWIDDMCTGPLISPVLLDRGHHGGRPDAHHNPLRPFKAEGRIRYNPRAAGRQLREMGWPGLG